MKNDRFLTVILISVGLLILAALVLFFRNGRTQAYLPEDNPAAIVHNYTLAITQQDYARAYGYLMEGEHKPDQAEFRRLLTQFLNRENAGAGLRIGETEIVENDAYVDVVIVYPSSGPFDDGYRQQDTAFLVLQEDVWKIKDMPYPYWEYSWYTDIKLPN